MTRHVQVGLMAVGLLLGVSRLVLAFPIDLGTAGPSHWAILEMNGYKVSSSHVHGNVVGNVGVNSGGKLVLSGGSQVQGDLYLGINPDATTSFSGGSLVTGTTYHDAASQAVIDQAVSDALAATAAASALAGTAIANINTTTTLMAPGVYDLSKIDLNNEILTLSGSATDYYLFNVGTQLKLNNSSIVLDGGLTWYNVLFNIEGTTDVSLNNFTMYGIVLAPYAKGNMVHDDSILFGEFIGGKDIVMSSGARVENPGDAPGPKVPDTGSTLLLTLIAIGTLRWLRARVA